MTARPLDHWLPLDLAAPLGVESARQHVADAALRPDPVGRVGLELESHLVDLAHPVRRPGWSRVAAAVAGLPPMPGGSLVTVEPGGQVELSTPPCADVAGAVDVLRRDEALLRGSLGALGLGLAGLGTDPARASRRVHPAGRYAAMEQHWAARGTPAAGAAMMCSTASLQVNLDAGPVLGWPARVDLAHRLGPVMVAISACSPMLSGAASGWRSMRQQVWGELDQARCGPVLGGSFVATTDPGEQWADYALAAPVMLRRDEAAGVTEPVRAAVPFADWASGEVLLGGRLPSVQDLDYHLTTLFPPVRLRGFVELRYLDAVPRRWWPALAAVTTVLLDDPVAAEAAAAACEPVRDAWVVAARDGLADPRLRVAADRCLQAAVAACPGALRADVEVYAELVAAGRTPGDEVRERVERVGPLRVLEEEADA